MALETPAGRPGEPMQFFGRPAREGDAARDHAAVPAGFIPGAPRSAAARFAAMRMRLGRALPAALLAEWDRGTAFCLIPVLMGAGAIAYFSLHLEPPLALLLGAASMSAVCAWAARARLLLFLAIAATAAFLSGMVFAKIETLRAATEITGSQVTTRLTARVAGIEHQASGRVRLMLDVVSTERPALRYQPERVRATARAVPEGLLPGEAVTGLIRLMPPSGPVRPQSYDFAFERYFDRIGASGFFLGDPVRSEADEPGRLGRALAWVEEVRLRLSQRIAERIGGAEGAIAAALITGIRAGIPEEVNEALRVTGLYHVISISGLHMALVAGTIMVTARSLFALFPAFASRRQAKKLAAVIAILATAFYLFISGNEVAARRSFIMLAVMLGALLFDRNAITMRNLAISAIIILALSPHEATGPSFQMSFAATAALVAGYAAWSEHRRIRSEHHLPPNGPAIMRLPVSLIRYAGGLAMTSILAGTATTIYSAWHFQQVAPLGLFANLAAMPAVSVLVMPFAVFAALLMPLGLDGPALDVMGFGIAVMNWVAFRLAELTPYDMTGMIPAGALFSLTAALLILTLATTWLRAFALPFLLAGVLFTAERRMPDILVAEDARLVAVAAPGGAIAVNRARPNAFTLRNWERAMNASLVLRPQAIRDAGASWPAGPAGASLLSETGPALSEAVQEGRFVCMDDLCLARHAGGAVVAHAATGDAARAACATADLLVVDDATAEPGCGAHVAVLTKRDLARRGSAAITLVRNGDGFTATISHAIREPYRPWHEHRRFSREARGLPAYQRP